MGKRGSLFLAGESTPFLANVERQWGRWGGSGVCVCGGVTSPLTQFHLGNFKHKHQSVSSVQLMLLMMSHVARNPRLKDGSRRHDSNTAHVYQFDKQAVLGRCYSDAHTHTHTSTNTQRSLPPAMAAGPEACLWSRSIGSPRCSCSLDVPSFCTEGQAGWG